MNFFKKLTSYLCPESAEAPVLSAMIVLVHTDITLSLLLFETDACSSDEYLENAPTVESNPTTANTET